MTPSMAVAYDPRIDHRHVRLAIIWLAVLVAIGIIGVTVEYVVISHYVTTLTDDLFRHLVPNSRLTRTSS